MPQTQHGERHFTEFDDMPSAGQKTLNRIEEACLRIPSPM